MAAIYVPIIITWFVRSKGYNDFALRGVILPLLLAVGISGWLADTQNGWRKYLAIAMIIINLFVSAPGFVYEYASRWKTRAILDPYESELVLALRNSNDKTILAAVGKDEWIFKIPPLAFKPIMTSDMYDSGAYLQDIEGKRFGHYETKEKNIYFRSNQEKTLAETITTRNKYLDELKGFVNNWEYDWVIFDRRMGVKKGVNFWSELYHQLGVKKQEITPTFWAFDRRDLAKKLESINLVIDGNNASKLLVKDNKVNIEKGFWYIASCEENGDDRLMRFEPEDQYIVYEDGSHGNSCIGNLFFAPRSGEYKLIGDSGDSLWATPVKLNKQI